LTELRIYNFKYTDRPAMEKDAKIKDDMIDDEEEGEEEEEEEITQEQLDDGLLKACKENNVEDA
jgi:hypothetical protein